ncbi:MAG: exodeoxyribonuclease VII small subunit [Bacteriovoracaceae bacterium]
MGKKEENEKLEIKDFEKNLEVLEGIVEKLESGKMNLDKSLKEFEKGVELYSDCRKMLTFAEKKVSKLTELLQEDSNKN